jgi:GntR family transcriptional regulator
MRLWLSKNSEVPIHEQLVTQIVLGIVSNDLKVKQRLPSTRDLARRYQIHANTVSAAYRELARRGWVEFRKGSGVYVRSRPREDGKLDLDQLVARFFKATRAQGYSLSDLQSAIQRALTLQPPDHFLVIERDVELQAILVAEIADATNVKVVGVGLDEASDPKVLMGAVPVVLFGHAEEVCKTLSKSNDLLVLNSASVVERMTGQQRPPADALVAVVSRWPEFLRWSKTMLLAAGLDADALSIRDARERAWEKGIRSAAFVITDSLMAPQIPAACEKKVFRVLSAASLNDVKDYAAQQFVKNE